MTRLRYVAAVPLALLSACQSPSGFVEGSTIGVVAGSPKQLGHAVFVNSHTGEGLAQFPENEWATVNVAGVVPGGTKAVYLSGLLIITHGAAEETCDLTVAYRNLGDTTDYPYIAQTVETAVAGGQRTPHSIWVPVQDGKFQIKWRRSTQGQWPDHCAYGINLSLVAYVR